MSVDEAAAYYFGWLRDERIGRSVHRDRGCGMRAERMAISSGN
jgi:hypothetical protein